MQIGWASRSNAICTTCLKHLGIWYSWLVQCRTFCNRKCVCIVRRKCLRATCKNTITSGYCLTRKSRNAKKGIIAFIQNTRHRADVRCGAWWKCRATLKCLRALWIQYVHTGSIWICNCNARGRRLSNWARAVWWADRTGHIGRSCWALSHSNCNPLGKTCKTYKCCICIHIFLYEKSL